MPLKIENQGQNNEIFISEKLRQTGTGTIVLRGDGNKIFIADSIYNFGGFVSVNRNCRINIGENINCGNLFVYMDHDAVLSIGSTVGFNGMVRISMHEPGRIGIGDGCLFADQVEMSVSDMHSIVDATSGARLNPAKDISIGNRVWVGSHSLVLKGVNIGDGSIVGAKSVVTRNVPSNCVVAGNPAKVVRENATWNFQLL